MVSRSAFEVELICLAGGRLGRRAVRQVPQVSSLNTLVDGGLFTEMGTRGGTKSFGIKVSLGLEVLCLSFL